MLDGVPPCLGSSLGTTQSVIVGYFQRPNFRFPHIFSINQLSHVLQFIRILEEISNDVAAILCWILSSQTSI